MAANQKKRIDKLRPGIVLILCAVLLAAFMPVFTQEADAASWKLKYQSIHIAKGQKVSLMKKGCSRSGTRWYTSDKKVAAVTKSGAVKGKNYGTATITCKRHGKKYACKVSVERKRQLSARKLRNYVLEHGKKDTGGWYSIKKVWKHKEDEDEINQNTSIIKAKRGNYTMKFSWDFRYVFFCSEAEQYFVTMDIDLINGAAGNIHWENSMYGNEEYPSDAFDGVINRAAYTKDGAGLEDGSYKTWESKEVTDENGYIDYESVPVVTVCAPPEIIRYGISSGFKYWNSHVKKAGVSMNSIGFSSYK